MTPDYKALREAADEAKLAAWPSDGYSDTGMAREIQAADMPFVSLASPSTILSLLDALAASEANLEKAREALQNIRDPISAMQQKANKSDMILDGQMAVSLSKSAEYLKSIASTTLKDIT
jgi:hypothetical protein